MWMPGWGCLTQICTSRWTQHATWITICLIERRAGTRRISFSFPLFAVFCCSWDILDMFIASSIQLSTNCCAMILKREGFLLVPTDHILWQGWYNIIVLFSSRSFVAAFPVPQLWIPSYGAGSPSSYMWLIWETYYNNSWAWRIVRSRHRTHWDAFPSLDDSGGFALYPAAGRTAHQQHVVGCGAALTWHIREVAFTVYILHIPWLHLFYGSVIMVIKPNWYLFGFSSLAPLLD